MKNKRIQHFYTLGFIIFSMIVASCAERETMDADYGVIPLPQEVKKADGHFFALKKSTRIIYPQGDELLKQTAGMLAVYIEKQTGYKLKATAGEPAKGSINLLLSSEIDHAEGYQLTVSGEAITITGKSAAGVFYGVQTLRKSLPASTNGVTVLLSPVEINDYPRFKHRGMMLDVARHFYAADSVKKYIDLMALHNFNTLHLHLTDDQGWRVEIKKYPALTELGSMRKETFFGHTSMVSDGKPHGGFYTQDQLRDIVAYAQQHFITVIPEVDMPGHMMAALTAYPSFGCTGGPYEVATRCGVKEDVLCAGNEDVMQFTEDVLAEIMEIFPSEYVHIGGDECPKARWEACPKCQARIKAENLKSDKVHSAEHRLQSYFITRIEKFVNSKGRKIIGWDEILEGGLAPNATVMSWRGMKGGIAAAQTNHDVIMSPNSHAYFDFYQTQHIESEPLVNGGYLPIERVYQFEPVPDVLTNEQKKHILGGQANVWTEYATTYSMVEHMSLPRMSALSEVLWTNASAKDFNNFISRLYRTVPLFDILSHNYARYIFDVKATFTPDYTSGSLKVELAGLSNDGIIYYTLDGSEPSANSTKYETPLQIKENTELKAVIVREQGNSRIYSEAIRFNKAALKPVELKEMPSSGYTFTGAPVLTDGLCGYTNYKTGRWLGYIGNNLNAVIDLKEQTQVSSVSFNTNVKKRDGIMGAAGIIVNVSDDGKNFREAARKKIPSLTADDEDKIYSHTLSFPPVNTRYLQVIIESDKTPATPKHKASNAFLFVDEITVE